MLLSTEFRRSIKPFIIINSIFTTGMMEYFVDNKINAIGFIHTCSSIIFYITLLCIYSFPTSMDIWKKPTIECVTFLIYIYSDYCNHIGTFIAGILRRKKVRRFTLQIETCVRAMDQLNIPMNLSKCFWQQCYVILIFVFFLIIMIVIDYSWLVIIGTSFWRICVAFYIERYPFIVLLITDFTIIFWMWYIKEKFRELNKLLKSMLTSTINSPQHKRVIGMSNNWENNPSSSDIIHTHKSNDNVLKIKKIREIHLELIKCAKNTNDAYGYHILLSVLTSFIILVTSTYSLYRNFMTQNYYLDCLYIYWLTLFGFKLVMISDVSSKTVTEIIMYWNFVLFVLLFMNISINVVSYFSLHAMNTGDILCELYEPSTSKEFRAEIYDFILQLLQNPLSLTGCGFFDLDHSLIRNVISIIITYLVILIQVGSTPSNIRHENTTLSIS